MAFLQPYLRVANGIRRWPEPDANGKMRDHYAYSHQRTKHNTSVNHLWHLVNALPSYFIKNYARYFYGTIYSIIEDKKFFDSSV